MLIPDYVPIDALLVPHLQVAVRPVLESIAHAACSEAGVILVSDDPASSARFVQTCPVPDHISLVAASPDTPWIRDLSPFPMVRDRELHWLQPRPHMPDRERDAALFQTITRMPMEPVPYRMPRGNVVVGPDGLILCTTRFFADNDLEPSADLDALKGQLGVATILFFPPLPMDSIAHADCYVRFLSPNCVALARFPDQPRFQETMTRLADALANRLPGLTVLRLPVKAGVETIASPLNWIQLGARLLVPDVPELTAPEKVEITETLAKGGFRVTWLPTPDIDMGGSLHCLTASVFAQCPESMV
jgi:agmatine/peptidylarginine deiminase